MLKRQAGPATSIFQSFGTIQDRVNGVNPPILDYSLSELGDFGGPGYNRQLEESFNRIERIRPREGVHTRPVEASGFCIN
jgi:hypothetical protein